MKNTKATVNPVEILTDNHLKAINMLVDDEIYRDNEIGATRETKKEFAESLGWTVAQLNAVIKLTKKGRQDREFIENKENVIKHAKMLIDTINHGNCKDEDDNINPLTDEVIKVREQFA